MELLQIFLGNREQFSSCLGIDDWKRTMSLAKRLGLIGFFSVIERLSQFLLPFDGFFSQMRLLRGFSLQKCAIGLLLCRGI